MNQQVDVLDGDALAVGLALLDEVADLVGEGLADLEGGAELVVSCAVGELLGDGELEAVCVGLAEALVTVADTWSDAEIVTVSAWWLAVEVRAGAVATALPVGDPAPLFVVPYTRNATTAMPAKPPVSISPTPRRFSDRRAVPDPDRRASSFVPFAAREPRSPSSSAKEMPRRPPPADGGARSGSVASMSETTGGRGLSAGRSGSAGCGPVTRSPSYGSGSATGSRAGGLTGSSSATGGMLSVERESCTLESSSPVAPQPGQDTAPLRCLRQVLQ